MDPARRRQLIERYRAGVAAVLVAVDHVGEDELDLRPSPRSLTAREAVHHLADAELHDGISLRRMLVENMPVLLQWDELHYRERLHYDRPIPNSVGAFQAVALANIDLLGSLTEAQWRREGNQQRPWTMTVEGWLEEKIVHLHDSLMHIVNAPSGGRVIADPG